MAKDKISLPSSQGGLVRYSEDSTSRIAFKPAYIILLVIVVLVIAMFLHWQGSALLGI